jgi:hypothetical protein
MGGAVDAGGILPSLAVLDHRPVLSLGILI